MKHVLLSEQTRCEMGCIVSAVTMLLIALQAGKGEFRNNPCASSHDTKKRGRDYKELYRSKAREDSWREQPRRPLG